MRLTWSVPLPGPFRVSGRVGGRRRSDGGLVITALAYLIVAVVAVVYGIRWLRYAAWACGSSAGWPTTTSEGSNRNGDPAVRHHRPGALIH